MEIKNKEVLRPFALVSLMIQTERRKIRTTAQYQEALKERVGNELPLRREMDKLFLQYRKELLKQKKMLHHLNYSYKHKGLAKLQAIIV